MSDKNDRKERVIHTRVPAVLEKELKRLADSLRVPVSNVVRTILEDAVEAVDSVGQRAEGELREVAERVRRQRDALRGRAAKGEPRQPARYPAPDELKSAARAPLAGIIGYQPLLLARSEPCALCGRSMAAGDTAYLGIRESALHPAGPRVILGKECLPFSAADDKEQKS